MSGPGWSDEIYLAFADMATAAAQLGAALGVTIAPAGPFPVDDGASFDMAAPMTPPWQTPPANGQPGVAMPGFWVMLTLDQTAASYAARRAALATYEQTLAQPPQVFL